MSNRTGPAKFANSLGGAPMTVFISPTQCRRSSHSPSAFLDISPDFSIKARAPVKDRIAVSPGFSSACAVGATAASKRAASMDSVFMGWRMVMNRLHIPKCLTLMCWQRRMLKGGCHEIDILTPVGQPCLAGRFFAPARPLRRACRDRCPVRAAMMPCHKSRRRGGNTPHHEVRKTRRNRADVNSRIL